jgi:hypothetical protein
VTARSIAEAMFSQDLEVSDARLEALLDEVDCHVSAASSTIRIGLRLALLVIRLAPLLLFFRPRTIERLSVDERVAVLTRLERSSLGPLSLAFVGWRTVMTLVFYEAPAELAAIGYEGEERHRYKRQLPLLVVPPAEESGVRLREDEDLDSERAARPRDVA